MTRWAQKGNRGGSLRVPKAVVYLAGGTGAVESCGIIPESTRHGEPTLGAPRSPRAFNGTAQLPAAGCQRGNNLMGAVGDKLGKVMA